MTTNNNGKGYILRVVLDWKTSKPNFITEYLKNEFGIEYKFKIPSNCGTYGVLVKDMNIVKAYEKFILSNVEKILECPERYVPAWIFQDSLEKLDSAHPELFNDRMEDIKDMGYLYSAPLYSRLNDLGMYTPRYFIPLGRVEKVILAVYKYNLNI